MALPKVTHSDLTKLMELVMKSRHWLLIVGKPGIGKTVGAVTFAEMNGIDYLVSNPGISDPTDFKGLPAKVTRQKPVMDDMALMLKDAGLELDEPTLQAVEEIATFLPFGDLLKIIEADRPMFWILDDLGQAPVSVQTALMPPLSSGMIGNYKLSEHVYIIATTNGREHKAGVKGLLEPVKSRFGMIVELEPKLEDFTSYGYANGYYQPIMDFVHSTPHALCDFKANNGMENSPNPRLWEKLSDILKAAGEGIDKDLRKIICQSCIGESWGAQFNAFLSIYVKMPRYIEIIAEPEEFPMDHSPDIRMAILGMLANQGQVEHSKEIFTYINKLNKESQVVFFRSLSAMKSPLRDTEQGQRWLAENMEIYCDI